MHPVKSAASMTASLEDFQVQGPLDRPLSALLGSRRQILIISGLLLLCLAILAAAALGWLASAVKPSPQPLSGTWDCSLAGEPVGILSVDGWNYVLGSTDAGEPKVGTLERVVFGKYREEFIKVQSGTLRENFGINLGYHYHLAARPEALVFSIGPGSGIRCARM